MKTTFASLNERLNIAIGSRIRSHLPVLTTIVLSFRVTVNSATSPLNLTYILTSDYLASLSCIRENIHIKRLRWRAFLHGISVSSFLPLFCFGFSSNWCSVFGNHSAIENGRINWKRRQYHKGRNTWRKDERRPTVVAVRGGAQRVSVGQLHWNGSSSVVFWRTGITSEVLTWEIYCTELKATQNYRPLSENG